jgi:hypothetical protein
MVYTSAAKSKPNVFRGKKKQLLEEVFKVTLHVCADFSNHKTKNNNMGKLSHNMKTKQCGTH